MSNATSAVIGAGIVSFLPGLAATQKNKVKLALAMAERATATAYKEGLIKDWFAYYRNQLKFLGWDAVTAEQIHWPDKTRTEQTDHVLQTFSKAAGDSFASSINVSMRTLLSKPTLLKELEKKAFERQHFQLLACAPAGNNRVDMVLYHETDKQSVFSAGFISRKRGHKHVRAELVRFNILAFENSVLPNVQESVVKVYLERIHDYGI